MTAFGRVMIEKTKEEVEEKYRIENGYDFDAKVKKCFSFVGYVEKRLEIVFVVFGGCVF